MNELDNLKHIIRFKDIDVSYLVSGREIRPDIDVLAYLAVCYVQINAENIEGVFGNTSMFSRLYGGRSFSKKNALTNKHIKRMYDNNIGLALTLTNHFCSDEAYRESLPLLRTNHRKGNSIVCTNDELALKIKNDFPDYQIRASMIKNIKTIEGVKKALEIYDAITLSMDLNTDNDFLDSIKNKDKIILFGNATCAYTCPERNCYLGFSQQIFGKSVTSICSKKKIPRVEKGYVYFDIDKLYQKGFSRFKLIPPKNAPRLSELSRKISSKKNYFLKTAREEKGLGFVFSYQKSGRTWLRFILANYFNLKFGLNANPDLTSMFSIMPNDWSGDIKGEGAYNYSDDKRFPLIIFSHKKPDQNSLFKKEKGILLLRNVFDVVVSEYFHTSGFLKMPSDGMDSFVKSEKVGLARYVAYINSWAGACEDIKIITYEDLHKNAFEIAKTVLSFLGVKPDKDFLIKSIELSSFKNMSELEKKKGIPGAKGDYSKKESRRMRKGEIGGGRDYLSNENIKHIKDYWDKNVSPQAFKILKKNNIDWMRYFL